MRPNTIFSFPTDEETRHNLLHEDDLHGWELCSGSDAESLNGWVRQNILHAMEACPQVLHRWRQSFPDMAADSIQFRYVAAALEALDDDTKTEILSGYCHSRAQEQLHEFLANKTSAWAVFSPSWIGPADSDLREVAKQAGWRDLRLIGQVAHAIERPDAARWSKWVPYAHSICVLQRGAKVAWGVKNPVLSKLGPMEKKGQSWAAQEDMALALALIKHLPHYQYTLRQHVEQEPVAPELQEQMDALVAVHAGLGTMTTLNKMMVSGLVHRHETLALVELPELGP